MPCTRARRDRWENLRESPCSCASRGEEGGGSAERSLLNRRAENRIVIEEKFHAMRSRFHTAQGSIADLSAGVRDRFRGIGVRAADFSAIVRRKVNHPARPRLNSKHPV